MQGLYRGVTWRRNTPHKVCFLTFDDGPIPEITPSVLDILAKYQVPATFFVVGDNVRKHPELLKRIFDEGHRVGNHTFHHIKGLATPNKAYLADVAACEQQILSSAPDTLHQPLLFRPPYGRIRHKQKRALLLQGYEIILWDVLTHDYNRHYTSAELVDLTLRYTRPGSIITFHDSLKAGDRMLHALPQVITMLQNQGYHFEKL